MTSYYFTKLDDGISGKTRRLVSRVEGAATSSCLASNTDITYDSNGFKDTETDGVGNITDYDFNSLGLLVKKTSGLQSVSGAQQATSETQIEEFDWYSNNLIKETRKEGKTTQYTYFNNRLLRILKEIDTTTTSLPYSTQGVERTWTHTYTYHDANESQVDVHTIDGPRNDVNDVVEMHYNPQGLLTQYVEYADGASPHVTTITEYTQSGLPARIEDANSTRVLTYNARNWLTSSALETNRGTATTQYFYDNVGQVIKVITPDDFELNYSYDAAHRLTAIIDSKGEKLEYLLDSFGNAVEIKMHAADNTVHSMHKKVFDDLGRLWKVLGINDQVVQQNSYDESNNLISQTDAYQRSIIYAYNALNQLKSQTDREGGVTEYVYNKQGLLTQVKDPKGLLTTYTLDGFGRTIQQDSADTGITVFHYDLADNLIREVDARGVVTEYAYDALNRIKTKSYPASPQENLSYFYDEMTTLGQPNFGLGRLTGIAQSNGQQIDFVYNEQGQIVQDIRTIGDQLYTTHYEREFSGQLQMMTYPNGRQVEYKRNDLGQVSHILTRKSVNDAWVSLVTDIEYKPFGPISSYSYGNGVTQYNEYDLFYRPTLIETLDGPVALQGFSYAFNENNELTNISNLNDSAQNQLFLFDANQRLTQAIGAYGQIQYSYDSVGNRLSEITDQDTTDYSYATNSNRLLSRHSGQSEIFDYSTAGNMTQNGAFKLTYNNANRLVAVSENNASLANYELNALGQRIVKSASGTTTHYQYDLENHLISEMQLNSNKSRDYVYLQDQLVAIIDDNTASDIAEADLSIIATEVTSTSVTLSIANSGPDHAQNLVLMSTIPQGVLIESHFITSGECQENTAQINCSIFNLNAGEQISFNLHFSAANNEASGLAATLSSAVQDPVQSNNTWLCGQACNSLGEQQDWTIEGSDSDDTLAGSNEIDVINGYNGNDAIYGYQGNDKLYGEAGNDKLYGGNHNDELNGGEGKDSLYGEGGDDTLNGDDGDDILFGSSGHDYLNGGDGNDRLYGQMDNDVLNQ